MPQANATSAPSGKRAERSRQAIIAAAREVFVRDGFDVNLEIVAAAAGVSKVTVYNHFRSKEDLFTAVIGQALDEALGSTLGEARASLTNTRDVRKALTRTARALLAGVTSPSVLALRNLVTGELRRFPHLGRAWQERGPAQFTTILGEVFEGLSDRGHLTIADVQVATIQFVALTLYPHLVANAFGSSVDSELADRLVTEGVDMFLNQYEA
ncbi:TetR/AcrR family transcriptional regulator [Allorhizocola rhizosphaerae]|uniref:TetR/AcrR family transcriptional regulator n=1 Tax=Allorhizocola rhizosphaerae TaxID=1872709 RepID=UPI000E3D9A42|nr:TetR/AcrR family transcriptional regulator [Allorhizocola rhizosphaerae]